MKPLLILIALALSGCSGSNPAGVIEEVMKNCARPASIELRISRWNSEAIVKCEEIGPKAPRAVDQSIIKEM